MTTAALPAHNPIPWLDKKLFWIITPTLILLAAILLLSAGLHLANLDAIGDANTYYTAAVESMLQSWHNFFFVAAEPGGSVTVDKPPLGLWIEAAFALALGVEGWVVSLPNILAGIASVPLLYHLVRKHLGSAAGLIAALVMALTPVMVAADRNNTMDGMLVFTLLLAAWAFLKAAESGKLPWLLLGGFLVGAGFNIKMLQAFLPLPAFYALYFFAAKNNWLRKVLSLGLTTIVLLVVSLSWAVIVDLTPADQRPYIGSSENNTVMELIIGHNGLNRLFGGGNRGSAPAVNTSTASDGQLPQPSLPGQRPPADAPNAPQGMRPSLPDNDQRPQANDGPPGQPGNLSSEVGAPGLLRFFQKPLGKEMSWLLPFALVSLVLGLFTARLHLPLEDGTHKALLLWGGWLITCLVFFSMAEFFHAYYMIMLAPPLGAVIGLGFSSLSRLAQKHRWAAAIILLASAALTIAFQVYLASAFQVRAWWMAFAALFLIAGALLVALHLFRIPGEALLRRAGYAFVLAALLVVPAVWTLLTVADDTPNINLPAAYAGENSDAGQRPATGQRSPVDEDLLEYLQTRTADTTYLMAVPNAFSGAPYVLETGRPVLYMGGFNGSDPVVDAADLDAMVASNELRYVLFTSDRRGNAEIARWAASNCVVVKQFSQIQPNPARPARPNEGRQNALTPPVNGAILYDCQ